MHNKTVTGISPLSLLTDIFILRKADVAYRITLRDSLPA